MKLGWSKGIALVVGGLILGSVVSATANHGGDGPRGDGPGFKRHLGKMVRSDAVVEGEDGTFNQVRIDHGILKSVDGSTLTIEEADGETVEVTTHDETRFNRDGEKAELGDLETGDHVFTHRVKKGDADYVTEHVRAVSAERYAEMQARREACEDDPSQCPRHERRGMRRGDVGRARQPAGEREEMAA